MIEVKWEKNTKKHEIVKILNPIEISNSNLQTCQLSNSTESGYADAFIVVFC